jgi:hypothetical protein
MVPFVKNSQRRVFTRRLLKPGLGDTEAFDTDNAQVRVHDSVNKGPMRPLASIACVICAVAACGLAVLMGMEVSMFGFPDGYVTAYQKAAGPPLKVLTWVAAGLGVLFLGLAVSPIGAKARTIGWLVALVGLALVALMARIGIPWYFGTHLALDNGIGG